MQFMLGNKGARSPLQLFVFTGLRTESNWLDDGLNRVEVLGTGVHGLV